MPDIFISYLRKAIEYVQRLGRDCKPYRSVGRTRPVGASGFSAMTNDYIKAAGNADNGT